MPWRRTMAVCVLVLTVPGATLAQQPAARPRIGLALGGGSARGLAHIGLLQWFEEHRIPIDVIAGTSMGGLVGGSYATGLSPDEIQTVLETADWTLIFQGEAPFAYKSYRRKQDDRAFPSKLHFGLKGGLRLPSGLNEGQQVDLLLDAITLQYSEIASFDDLPTPFRCVAADLVSAQPVVLKDGSLSLAMRATMSLPGVFIPVRVGDRVMVDGGIFDNIPADVARAMGADIVIAVSVGGSDVAGKGTPAPSYSIFSVLGQMVDALMTGNTRRGLAAADLVIRPAVDEVASMDFRATKEIAALGYQAAEAHSADLMKYALDEQAYAEFRASRAARRRRDAIVPRAIDVTGVPEVSQAMIRARLASHLNAPLDVAALAKDITWLGGSDRYETIGYRIVTGPDGQVLRLNVQPKPYGPPFLAMGIDLTNTSGTNLQIGLGTRFTAFDVVGYGSEARIDLHVGTGFLLGGELFRPVGRSRWFVAPDAQVRQTETDLFTDDRNVATYRLTRSALGADLGYSTGQRSEVRLGYEAANVQASVQTGAAVLPELDGREQLARLQATFDGQDSPTIPSRGIYARGRVSYFFNTADPHGETPPFDEVFTTADIAVTWFKSINTRTRVLAAGVGGTAFGAEPLPPNSYALGGPFRLGAYNEGELRTPDFLVGSGGVVREFGRLPDILGGGVFGAMWLETGSAFDGAGVRTNLSTAFVMETLLGPMFVGTSVGFDGRYRVYLGMGPLFGRASR